MKNDADPRAHPWQKDAIKYANGQGERDAERDILCEDQAINPFPSNSSCTARPIGERVVHKLSILAPFILYRSLYMLDPFVCTPLFLPSAARPHGNEAKNPDFFLARCIFLPSFLTSCLLACWLLSLRSSSPRAVWVVPHISDPASWVYTKKKDEAKNREKILSAKYSNELAEGRELHTFLGHVTISLLLLLLLFFSPHHQRILAAFHARLVLVF